MSDTPTLEQRLTALENQAYIMYLQLNAVTKIGLDKGAFTHEEVTELMDELNSQIQEVGETLGEDEDGDGEGEVTE